MTMAVATNYNNRICCAVDGMGASNLVTFLEHTSGIARICAVWTMGMSAIRCVSFWNGLRLTKQNIDSQFYATVMFVKEYLLK